MPASTIGALVLRGAVRVKSAALHRELTASSQALPPLPHIPRALTSQPAEGAMAECADPEPKTASLQSPALTLVSCVTLGRLLDFSVPSFPHLLEVNNKISFVLHSLCFNYHLHGVNHSVTLGYSYCFSINY